MELENEIKNNEKENSLLNSNRIQTKEELNYKDIELTKLNQR